MSHAWELLRIVALPAPKWEDDDHDFVFAHRFEFLSGTRRNSPCLWEYIKQRQHFFLNPFFAVRKQTSALGSTPAAVRVVFTHHASLQRADCMSKGISLVPVMHRMVTLRFSALPSSIHQRSCFPTSGHRPFASGTDTTLVRLAPTRPTQCTTWPFLAQSCCCLTSTLS